MDSPVFLKGEHIIDGLAGLPEAETKKILSLKAELFDENGNQKSNLTKEQYDKTWDLIWLLNKRNILWKAILN